MFLDSTPNKEMINDGVLFTHPALLSPVSLSMLKLSYNCTSYGFSR